MHVYIYKYVCIHTQTQTHNTYTHSNTNIIYTHDTHINMHVTHTCIYTYKHTFHPSFSEAAAS